MQIVDQIGQLRVPADDIVLFRTAARRFAMNAANASWAELTPRQDALLCALARGEAVTETDERWSSRRELDRDLAQLVLNYFVYLPGWQPKGVQTTVNLNLVYYAITDGCNLRCPYCYDASERKLPGELKTAESMRLMEQIAEAGARSVIFTGGEPMMRRDLFDVARYARELGLRANIITNGSYIRNIDIARTMAEVFNNVTVSVDGGVAERHEATRGAGHFAKVVRALTLLNEAGVTPVINHVISNENVDYMNEIASLGERFRIKHVRTQYHSNLGRGQWDRLSWDWDDYVKNHEFMWTHPLAHHLIDDSVLAIKPCAIKSNCGMGGNEIFVSSLGDVYPCKLIRGLGELAGNVRKHTVAELFLTPMMTELRESTVFGGPVHTDCKRCYIKAACGGGCRAFHMAQSGDIRKNSRQLCRMLRHGQVSVVWRALGADKSVIDDPGAFVPIRPADGSVHPVYEDWRTDQPLVKVAELAEQVPARRLLPIVGVGV
jgi:radical SAM protein with 4Fe4S-binding SPASM domain